jgi:hypothetical protein
MDMFGKHLVDRGLLTETQLLDALETQSSTRPSIGRISFELGFLDLDQIVEVIAEQESGNGKLRFCAQAVALGFLTNDQRDELLAAQQDSRIPLGQTLVTMGLLASDDVAKELSDYEDGIKS